MERAGNTALSLFLRRLLLRSLLSEDEQQAILALPYRQVHLGPHREIVAPRKTVDYACLLADGLLARFDEMLDGGRSITALHIPGDMSDLHSVVLPTAGWGIATLTASTILQVPHIAIREIAQKYPAIATAFWRDGSTDANVVAKWVANIGRKSTRARIAHLLCEMGWRMDAAGLGTRERYALPATQEQIGDATGVTGVHVNRVLRDLREEGVASHRNNLVEIFDLERLVAVAEFDPAFLLMYGESDTPGRRQP
jgi:CRP-like cAMP-binding protein